MNKIKQVAVVGGTHGNEFSGIYLLRKWQKSPQLLAREGLEVANGFCKPKRL